MYQHDASPQAFVRKVAAAAGPLPSDMLLSDADALIASGDFAAAAAALQTLMEEQPDMVAEALAGLLKVALAEQRVRLPRIRAPVSSHCFRHLTPKPSPTLSPETTNLN